MRQRDLIYDWNLEKSAGAAAEPTKIYIEFDDETLRDGLQSPSAKNPVIEDKLRILHLMAELGIHSADIGYPSSSKQAYEDVTRIAKEIVGKKLPIAAGCAARTVKADIEPIVRISKETGLPIEVQTFIGSSPIRCYVEGWKTEQLLKYTIDAVDYAVGEGLDVMYVTEDTTRSNPDILRELYTTAIEHGAKRICVCDTVGHTTPEGVKNLLNFIKTVVEDSGQDVMIDWHGHNDRGLAVINSIAAIETGINRVHGTGLGLGERAGNTPIDLLLINLKLLGIINNGLTGLDKYCQLVHKSCGAPLPDNYPVLGRDAFRTATGVHAAAIIKAHEIKEDLWLRDAVYSGVPADQFGRRQVIEVGPMSGRANVVFWLKERGYAQNEDITDKILCAAKKSNRVLTDDEIKNIMKEKLCR